MACFRGPCLYLSKTCKMLSLGFTGFGDGLACDLGGTSREASMAGSWMGIRFPCPETIPCLVPFLDQTQPIIEGVRERVLE